MNEPNPTEADGQAGGGGDSRGNCAGNGAAAAGGEEEEEAFNRTDRLLRYPPGSAERYYTMHYLVVPDEGKGSGDQWVCEHPNGIFIVGLAPGHGVLEHCRSCGGTVTGVDFSPSQGSQGGGGAGGGKVISGKKKKGAAWVKARARLATITCSSGQAFHVLCGMEGQLLEVNPLLATDPNLLLTEGEGRGYLAIIQPSKFREPDRSELISAEAYRQQGKSSSEGTGGGGAAEGMDVVVTEPAP